MQTMSQSIMATPVRQSVSPIVDPMHRAEPRNAATPIPKTAIWSSLILIYLSMLSLNLGVETDIGSNFL